MENIPQVPSPRPGPSTHNDQTTADAEVENVMAEVKKSTRLLYQQQSRQHNRRNYSTIGEVRDVIFKIHHDNKKTFIMKKKC
ncbi:hypothetical protein XENTR_v10018836 [Xenopus tropicalis]|nr:hypothetical protein XENTR_v10018836 [Xenopus tropicalis]